MKKLLIAFIMLHTQLIKPKFIDLFKKEQVETIFQQEGKQNKFDKKNLVQPKQIVEQNPLKITITIVDLCSQHITISEMFNLFSGLITNKEKTDISEKQKIENNDQLDLFFQQYASQLLLHAKQLHNRSWKHKQNQEKLTIMLSFYLCLNDDKQNSLITAKEVLTIDAFIKNFDLPEQSQFPYIYLEKTLQKLIKTIKHIKMLKSMILQKQILKIHKQLIQIKQQIVQLPGYIYEEKVASQQANFSTYFLPYRYNQLPFIDRTTLNYFNTQSGKPQHEIRHQVAYAKW